ncbi:hypothetical protein WL80_05270 [Burkholderia ubonensis]|uniref:hypothetical protein n=1 Tax=Burkholderia ubonensis TaxID=101571 RepID=UPI00076D0C0C|nr:hypothetical protein [Burkholderia ubonensis]KWE96747.1 hypothetical protein WL80_05270 [Burkholderia ubonensis]
MVNGTDKTGRRTEAAAKARMKRSAGGTGVATAALMLTAPYLGSCAPDDSDTTQIHPPASLASPVPASPTSAATGARPVAELAGPPVRSPFDVEKKVASRPGRPAFRAPSFAPARRSAIAVLLDDRLLGGPPLAGLADRPPLPSGPLPDEGFDPFQPHLDGPVLSYAGTAASLRARTADCARFACIAAPALPPLPGGTIVVQRAGPADSPFYADQVADALARHPAFGGTPAPGSALAGVAFYADQIAEARMRPPSGDASPRPMAMAADVVASLVSRFPFDVPDPKPVASPSIALSTLGGETGYHALLERRAAFTEPRVLAGLLDALKPTLTASPLPPMRVAGLAASLDGRLPVGPQMSASADELAAQVASIGGRPAPVVADARAEGGMGLAVPGWRVTMRARTDAVPGAGAGERSRFGRGARANTIGRGAEGLPTIVADMRTTPPAYDARATARPAAVSGMPSAVEIAAALVQSEGSGRSPAAKRKPNRTTRDAAMYSVDAGRDTGWRAASATTVADERHRRPRWGGVVYDNIMASVAATAPVARGRTVNVDMPRRGAYGDVAMSVAALASNRPS